MTPTTTDFAPIRFSTDDIPEPIRAARWREAHAQAVRMEAEPLSDRPSVSTCLLALPGLKVQTTHTTAMRLRRTRALIADANDDFRLCINLAGPEIIHHRGREIRLSAREAVLISCADLGVAARMSPGRSLGLHIAYAVLAPLVANIEDAVMRPIRCDTQALRLLIGYIGLFQEGGALATPQLRQSAIAHIHNLAALAIGATPGAAALAEERGTGATRLHAIKADVIVNLGRADFSITALSRRHRLQPRYIQRLFESDGTTFSEFLLDRRLAQAHRLLTDPRERNQAISTVAFACGFGDLSYFNRRFRRSYGSAPSHFRAVQRADEA